MAEADPLRVRLFSVLRERTGEREILLESAGLETVGGALSRLGEQYPVIAEYRRWIRPAVNRAYAVDATPIAPGDELALITPVSGG